MKRLLDNNLSPKLALRLTDVLGDVVHVRQVGLRNASDEAIWSFAVEQERTIVTKDQHFVRRGLLVGPPPRIVWLTLGNTSTTLIETTLRQCADRLRMFHEQTVASVLVLP